MSRRGPALPLALLLLAAPPPPAAAAGGGLAVRITSPAAGDFVFGKSKITAEVEADSPQLVAKVEFYIDDVLTFIDKEPPYEFVHEFGDEPRSYVIRAEAYRTDGVTASDMRVTRRLVIHYQTSVDRVVLTATALDKDGRPVLDMTRDDFTLLEDGAPQQILDFYVEQRPIAMAIVIDTSGSMRDAMRGTQAAAGGFVDTLEAEDRAMVMDFDEKVFLLQPLTGDRDSLKKAIDSTYSQGGTAVYDAMFSAFRILNPVEGRKAIVLLTDGDDYDSHFSLDRVLEIARSSEVVIYTIGLGGSINKAPLRDLAQETGGRAFFPGGVNELVDTYAQVARELRSQYYLTYSASNQNYDGAFRKIKLEPKRDGVTIRTRRGYYAVPPASRVS
jgi:VWFA-related protein